MGRWFGRDKAEKREPRTVEGIMQEFRRGRRRVIFYRSVAGFFGGVGLTLMVVYAFGLWDAVDAWEGPYYLLIGGVWALMSQWIERSNEDIFIWSVEIMLYERLVAKGREHLMREAGETEEGK